MVGLLRRNLFSVGHLIKSAFKKCIPAPVTRLIGNVTTYLLFTRNPCIQLFYGFIVTGGTAIYTFKVIPYFDKINIFSIITYILIAINVTLFWICSTSEPGIITALHHADYMNDYEPDGVYYTLPECYTCKLIKPARSKHCSLCDVCVSRFDHHCSWVNNCIGKKNYKFFWCFITSSAVLCVYVTFVVVVVFAYIVMSDGLINMQYVDDEGKHYQVGIRFLSQFLLVRHSLLAILFLTVLFFGVAMSGFSLFHLYLVLTNQTTNEFNKRCFGKTQTKTSRQAKITTSRTETTTGRTSKRRTSGNKNASSTILTKATAEKTQSSRNRTPYNRGIWRNIAEVLRG
ncbi:hypothetical protein ACROYT_G038700 [Oculina patagonica]